MIYSKLLNILLLFSVISFSSCDQEVVQIVNSELIRSLPGRPEGLIKETATFKFLIKGNDVKLKKVSTWYSSVELASPTNLKKGETISVNLSNSYPASDDHGESPEGPGGFELSIGTGENLKSQEVKGCRDCSSFDKENNKAQIVFLVGGKEHVFDLKAYSKEEEVALP